MLCLSFSNCKITKGFAWIFLVLYNDTLFFLKKGKYALQMHLTFIYPSSQLPILLPISLVKNWLLFSPTVLPSILVQPRPHALSHQPVLLLLISSTSLSHCLSAIPKKDTETLDQSYSDFSTFIPRILAKVSLVSNTNT